MKKIVFLLSLAICGINFSAECKWISDKPTYYEKKMIELIKKKKLENRVYCDSDNDRMVYQTVNKNEYSENFEIGLIYNEKEKKTMTYEILFDYIDKFEEDVRKILPLNLNDRDYDFAPKNYNYRMYIYFPDTKDTHMVIKKVLDMHETEWYSFYSNEFFSKEDNYENDIRKVFEENETYPTDDIVY